MGVVQKFKGGYYIKILVLSHMYPNQMNEVYGIFVANQVSELIKLGHEVKVISPVPWSTFPLTVFSSKWRQYAQIPRREIRQGIEVFYPRVLVLPNKYLYQHVGRFYYWGIRKVIKEISREFDFDLIHAHTALPDGFAAMILKEKLTKPVVLTIHGQDMFSNIHMGPKCKATVIRALNNADRIVAVSSKLKRDIKQYVPEYKIDVIPNGITTGQLVEDSSDLKQKFPGKKIILSVGYLRKRKGHRYVLEALSQLVKEFPNLIYLIIGDGMEEELLKKQVAECSLDPYVKFLGRKSNQEVMNYMSACDIFVLPSWKEGFGIVYLEAMAHGKPVIGCQGEGIEDVVSHGINGILVPPKDTAQLIEALRKLLNNERMAVEIGQRAKETVVSKFTWSRVAGELENLFQGLLEINRN